MRFAALARVGAVWRRASAALIRPDVVHAHDWQAGLVGPTLLYDGGRRPGR